MTAKAPADTTKEPSATLAANLKDAGMLIEEALDNLPDFMLRSKLINAQTIIHSTITSLELKPVSGVAARVYSLTPKGKAMLSKAALESSTPDESLKALEAVEEIVLYERGQRVIAHKDYEDLDWVLGLIAQAKAAQGEPKEMRTE